MTSRDFAYWLQGFFEMGNPKTLNEEQEASDPDVINSKMN